MSEVREHPDLLFFDGACGLCHGSVRFAVHRDRDGAIRYAPIGGPTWQQHLTPKQRETAPDSVLVLTAEGELLERSDAALRVLRRLPWPWSWLGGALGWIPRPLRDATYDWVARRRRRWFRTPSESCPLVPAELRPRFDP